MLRHFRLLFITSVVVAFGVTGASGSSPIAGDHGVTVAPGFPARAVCTEVELAATIASLSDVIPQPGHCLLGAEALQAGRVTLDSLSVHVGVPSLHRQAVYFDHNDMSLVEIELPDLLTTLQDLFPRGRGWLHDRVDDNADAHLASMFLGHATAFPIKDGRLYRGTWQNIFLVELDGPRTRRVLFEVLGTA